LYGGLDGSTTIIIVVLSGISSGTSASMVLAISIPTLVGHAVGMGLGDYLSGKAEIEYVQN
jgi:VIT1/CCC1 family predicted Fe2+/Mn2+ transporter